MESDDKINAWLSSQDQQDKSDSSIEIMMEDVTNGNCYPLFPLFMVIVVCSLICLCTLVN